MEDWKTFGQVAGGIIAYAILTKVFDFIRFMKRNDAPKVDAESARDLHFKLDKILRTVTRILDKM